MTDATTTPTDPALAAKQQEYVENMVEDDEWNGVTVQLQNLVSSQVVEDMKAKAQDFLSMDRTHKLRNVVEKVEQRVREEVATLRSKNMKVDEFSRSVTEKTKTLTEEFTGKAYVMGELSKDIDTKIKKSVATYVGKEEYETGDLSRAIADKAKTTAKELQENHKVQEIARIVNERRIKWITDILGEEAAKNYKFGDIYKKFATDYTGKETYEFGDISRKVAKDFTGEDTLTGAAKKVADDVARGIAKK